MPFFIKNRKQKQYKSETGNKRKFGKDVTVPQEKKKRKKSIKDEEIESDSDIASDEEVKNKKEIYTSSDEDEETAQEKKLRLAKQYLAQLEEEEAEKRDDDEIHRDIVSHRLKQDLLEQTGRLQKQVADNYLPPSVEDITVLRGHQLSVTCVIITPDNKHVFSASKDCSIIKWNVQHGKRVHTIPGGRKGTEDTHVGHTGQILSLAISSDGKFLVSGDRNKLIFLWNPDTCQFLHQFRGHRDAVSGLAFRKGTHQLFSASHDRTVKIWNVDERAYIETLYGHQDCITGIDSLTRDRAVTSGGRDGSVHIWKVIEESQLVFHGHRGSIDCVSLINESNFVSGGDDNSLALWSVMKKKPLVTVKNAHHGQEIDENENTSKATENWISAVVSYQNSDLLASGSKDGLIKFWKCANDYKSLVPLFSLPVCGFVNSLCFSNDGCMLIAGIGQEHKLGRWWRIKEAKNGTCIIRLKKKSDT